MIGTAVRWQVATTTAVALLFAFAGSQSFAQEADPPQGTAASKDWQEPTEAEIEAMIDKGEVIEIAADVRPGSGHSLGAAELERFEHDDIHKVLAAVPGVYIREEDGFGLRPNIGMRGTSSERSAKITLMEDGILSAPAPYAAPAAYYFPLITRMSRVEVLKGPAAIQYGPNTVGGALNLVSRPIPREREVTLDVAGGTNLYGKAHASYGQSWKYGGVVVEGVKLRSSGFRLLDGGGDTGFDKNDVLLKARLNSSVTSDVYQALNAKVGFSNEVSNETYTGLTDSDFRNTPYRRYAGTQLDRMTWNHLQLQLSHHVEFTSQLASITTTVYRNTFSRDWRKLNGFNSNRELRDILASPQSGNNAVFYAVLQGQADSLSSSETLQLGTNARDFVSQGLQVVGRMERDWLGAVHSLEGGIRLHLDTVDRFHFEEGHVMRDGVMRSTEEPMTVTKDSQAHAAALALHLRDRIQVGDLEITAGARTEVINTNFENKADASEDVDATEVVFIPGFGATYRLNHELGLLLGVHRGFSPAAPGPDTNVESEKSVNYETGFRLAKFGMASEVIAFHSNYSNLKGSCTFSSGCLDEQIGEDFNGGRVHIYGLEVASAAEWELNSFRFPFRLSYTLNHARFQSSFTSSNPQWGDVESGDEPPYLPMHQFSLQAGMGGKRWEVVASGTFTSATRDVAGSGSIDRLERTDTTSLIGLAGNYSIGTWGAAYVTVNNLLDQANIVSRRPYGARSGAPRTFILGYRNKL